MKRTVFSLLVYALLLPACAPGYLSAPATATSTPAPTSTATAFPTPTRTPIPPTATFTPTATSTPILTGPAIAVANAPAPCRAGPTNLFPLVVQLNAGEIVAVIGKASAHWILKPDGLAECWVDAALVTVSGAIAYLPDIPIPSSVFPPAAPTNLKRVRGTCVPIYDIKAYKLEYLLTWTDTSDNEEGFYVYRDANKVAELPANATQLTDTFILHSGGHLFNYYVVAYNSVGRAQSGSIWVRSLCG